MKINDHASPMQLALDVRLPEDTTFDNFFTTEQSPNRNLIELLKRQLSPIGEPSIYLWGRAGVGVSHLLQAACHCAESQGAQGIYLPLKELKDFPPEQLLDGLDVSPLVCLDGLECVVGRPEWEQALFHFFNRLRDSGGRLIMSADCGPHELKVNLPDLSSRLSWGLVYQVAPLSDDEKMMALTAKAKDLGLELSLETAQFILYRSSRDVGELFALLRQLDKASLSEQRRLTLPFVKKILQL